MSDDHRSELSVDYRTIMDAEGPLAITENVKFPTFGKIEYVDLSEGLMQQGQILEANKKKATVQVSEETSNVDNKNCHIECVGRTHSRCQCQTISRLTRSIDRGTSLVRVRKCWPRIVSTSKVRY